MQRYCREARTHTPRSRRMNFCWQKSLTQLRRGSLNSVVQVGGTRDESHGLAACAKLVDFGQLHFIRAFNRPNQSGPDTIHSC
jgi:hypothetical protein